MKNIIEIANYATKIANIQIHARKLNVPVLNGLTRELQHPPETIFLFTNGAGLTEEFSSEGNLSPTENLTNRINFIISKMVNYRDPDGQIQDIKMYYLGEYQSVFHYSVFFKDMILNWGDGPKFIRSITAFFVEQKEFNDLYQITINAGPYNFPASQLVTGIFDINKCEIDKCLDNHLKNLMNQICYVPVYDVYNYQLYKNYIK